MAKGPIARKNAKNPHEDSKEYYIQRYADGKPKPMFRGVLRGIMAGCLIAGALAMVIAIWLDLMPLDPGRWWPMVSFLACKGVSYSASAIMHLYPFRRVTSVSWAHKIDLITVPFGILATALPCVQIGSNEWKLHILLGLVVIFVNAALVTTHLKGHLGLGAPAARSETPRAALLVAYSVFSIWDMNYHYGSHAMWWLALVLYVVGLACLAPAHQTADVAWLPGIPWHAKERYGFHEDYHFLHFLGDVLSGLIGLHIIVHPYNDLGPSF